MPFQILLGHLKPSNRGNRHFVTDTASNHRTTEQQKVKRPILPSSSQKFSLFDDEKDFFFKEKLGGNLVLKVYSASITKLQVDVIVNAANDTLLHGGGVAKVIAAGAGRELDIESRKYIEKCGNLQGKKSFSYFLSSLFVVNQTWSSQKHLDVYACMCDCMHLSGP